MEKRQARSFNFLVPGVGLEEFSTPDDHFFIAKLIIFVAYVNWALFFSIGLHVQCMCIEQVKTETNLSYLILIEHRNNPYVFVHADDIKTHETFFNFTKQFFLFKQDKLVSVLTCSMHINTGRHLT
jgi:hypothetical protein